ncbi:MULTISPECIES: sn-glycerol-3-phosphate ABC transporter ATP-binding protein UgpC [Mesorhizobium]|jgi:multiple sugar transport system ATP-binding protein|uniref:Carbohydrate ABC transporter ATP-binding protein (CUT1 family) n=1 Tax=Rhizobium loti TaxID=381 RepID=A0A8E2WK47_RHILI|nr:MULTISPECIES: sn-glycerol-3-phosphate ABC transporter ATP-binding protein UgpC [Mesorhizobium]PWJ94464.1 carbohydrate ABC transporter ATP-binding protein (CUT1 family) [Mesorhizobium loti]RUX94622.1 sn-glycerol-3-phosphate ABC transporter ATP-binding protein UgpC [Mesorhizobium sp. M7D.F.Ca.US.004.01.2.1]RVA36123.1 sn-glycerol-3-phosphate ABC transporter ATP-binding protein UgpC [Mesorhizobium sp. M7D.F.Ca.US.004.03.1.1]
MAAIELNKVVKAYGDVQTVHGIDLSIKDHEFVVLVGPSGCGKSTTLRMIAGLETITGGEIKIGERRVNDLLPGERDIAMVFQNYALYPHLSVEDNITFGLRLKKTPRGEIQTRLIETARILDIGHLLKRKPRQLSGGQRQRVAMGRAMIRNPAVFLFDEPLSNLDAKLRVQMRAEIKQIHEAVPTTTVYVTHDQIEAMTLADRVVVMNAGKIEQIAPPQELYLKPATKFVAGFIGSPGMNFVSAALERHGEQLIGVLSDGSRLELPGGISRFADAVGRTVDLGIRPEHLSLSPNGGQISTRIEAVAELVEPLGMDTLVHFIIAGTKAVARVSPDASLRRGTRLTLCVDPKSIYVFDRENGSALHGD